MRTPARLRPQAELKSVAEPRAGSKPEPFRNIYFLTCVRCMGHGYFWTDPPQEIPTVVFSKQMALVHLVHFWEDELVSDAQVQVVGDQIDSSGLPVEIPPVVEEFVQACIRREVAVEMLASGDPEAKVCSITMGMEVAEAVHEFLLGEQGRPEFKTQ